VVLGEESLDKESESFESGVMLGKSVTLSAFHLVVIQMKISDSGENQYQPQNSPATGPGR
jgi:hypothetical protein